MLSHDGTSFRTSPEIDCVFDGVDQDKEKWMKGCSILVD